ELAEGGKAGVHAPRGAEEPPGQESEGPYERRSACNGRGAKGPREVDGVKLTQPERTPATVPEATHAGEVRSRWAWTEPTVWTDRIRLYQTPPFTPCSSAVSIIISAGRTRSLRHWGSIA